MKKSHIITIAILLLGLMATPLVGNKPVLVVSGSMEPAVQTGALTLVHFCEVADLQEGDIITYWSPDFQEYITHRVYSVGDDYVVTRGDANSVSDPTPVIDDMLMGKVVLVINATSGLFRQYLDGREFNRMQLVADMLAVAVSLGIIVYFGSLLITVLRGAHRIKVGRIETGAEQESIRTAGTVPKLLHDSKIPMWRKLRIYLSYRAYVNAAMDVADEVGELK